MINKLSTKIADKMLSKGTISDDDYELYVYGLFMLISHLIYLLLTCIFGLVFKCLIESIIFYAAFQFIRRYAGGYHASTETRCNIFSTLSIFGCIVIVKLSGIYDFQNVIGIIAIVSAICILILCPLDTPDKPLSENEYKYFRKISLIILLVICVLAAVSYFFNLEFAFAPLCMSLILESVLLVAGKINKSVLKKQI